MMGLNKTRRRNKGGSGLFPISIQSMRDSNVKVFILMKIQAELLLAFCIVDSFVKKIYKLFYPEHFVQRLNGSIDF